MNHIPVVLVDLAFFDDTCIWLTPFVKVLFAVAMNESHNTGCCLGPQIHVCEKQSYVLLNDKGNNVSCL